jgi:hypothetical protein
MSKKEVRLVVKENFITIVYRVIKYILKNELIIGIFRRNSGSSSCPILIYREEIIPFL